MSNSEKKNVYLIIISVYLGYLLDTSVAQIIINQV